VPQLPQKLASGGFSELHFGHPEPSTAPHRMQNFLSAAFWKLQLEQRIGLAAKPDD
jgi:hypothetical protein